VIIVLRVLRAFIKLIRDCLLAYLLSSDALFYSESYNGVCRYELFEKERHILVTCLLSVVIPLIIMAVLYGLMAIEARKQVRAVCPR